VQRQLRLDKRDVLDFVKSFLRRFALPDFMLADFDRDGRPDLVYITRRNTGNYTIEIRVLGGTSAHNPFVRLARPCVKSGGSAPKLGAREDRASDSA
jgi:hypothetical protein